MNVFGGAKVTSEDPSTIRGGLLEKSVVTDKCRMEGGLSLEWTRKISDISSGGQAYLHRECKRVHESANTAGEQEDMITRGASMETGMFYFGGGAFIPVLSANVNCQLGIGKRTF